MVVSKNKGYPKIDGFIMENLIKRDDCRGTTIFGNNHICMYIYILYISRWWFQKFLIVIPIWENDPIWLIFSDGVETTNHVNSLILQGIKSMPYLWLNILYIDENGCFSSELNIFDGLTFFANDLPQQNWLSRTFVWLNIPYHPCMVYSPTFSWCLW